jgi:hypothetical protein
MRNVALVIAALALLPAAAAQSPADPFTIVSVAQPGPIPYAGMVNVTVTVGAGCAALIQAAAAAQSQDPTASVTVQGPPTWLTVTPATVTLPAQSCLSSTNPAGSGYVAASGNLGLRVSADAPGVVHQTVNVTASLALPNGESQTDGESLAFNVTYFVNYTVAPSVTFPATVTGRGLNFTVAITYNANAPGMVMVEGMKESSGKLSGLGSVHYLPGETKTFAVRYEAPSQVWNETQVTFTTFAHYAINGTPLSGPSMLTRDTTWVFRNGNPGGAPDAEESPLGATSVVALLAALALVQARRRKA